MEIHILFPERILASEEGPHEEGIQRSGTLLDLAQS